jgi:hypothetical protein
MIPVAIALSIAAVLLSRKSIRDYRDDGTRANYAVAILSMCIAVPSMLLAIAAPILKSHSESKTRDELRARLEKMRREIDEEHSRAEK